MENNKRIIELYIDYNKVGDMINKNYNNFKDVLYKSINEIRPISVVYNEEEIKKLDYEFNHIDWFNISTRFAIINDVEEIDNDFKFKIELFNNKYSNKIWELYNNNYDLKLSFLTTINNNEVESVSLFLIIISESEEETNNFLIREKRKKNINKLLNN